MKPITKLGALVALAVTALALTAGPGQAARGADALYMRGPITTPGARSADALYMRGPTTTPGARLARALRPAFVRAAR